MVTYQFEIDDDTWNEWKDTVPRSKNLEQRIIELIEADTAGRVGTEDERAPETDDVDIAERDSSGTSAEEVETQDAGGFSGREPQGSDAESTFHGDDSALSEVEFPGGVDRDAAIETVFAARTYLREQGPASMRDVVAEVMPEHSLGYEVPELEAGERYRGAWWRRVVKPGLEALPDVERPPRGGSNWTYSRGDE